MSSKENPEELELVNLQCWRAGCKERLVSVK